MTNSFYSTIPGIERDEDLGDENLKTYKMLLPHIESEVNLADIIIVYFAAENSHLWVQPTNRLFANLKNDQKVLFLSDYPSLDKDPARLNRSIIKDESRAQSYTLWYSTFDQRIIEMIGQNPNARYVDLSKYNYFFDDAPFYRDTLMYFDSSHLNRFGAVKFEEVSGREFMVYLNWALNDPLTVAKNSQADSDVGAR